MDTVYRNLPRELRPDPLAGVAGAVEAEEGIGGAVFEEDPGGVLAEGRAQLEAVAGAAAEEPDVGGVRMAAEEEVAVRAVLVLADAGLQDRLGRQTGEAARQDAPRSRQEIGRDEPLAEGGVERRAPGVVRQFEATVLVARHAVVDPLPAEVDPGGAAVLVEPGVPRRQAEEEDFLAGGAEELLPDHLRKEPAQPGTAREEIEVRCERRAVGELQAIQLSTLRPVREGRRDPHLPPLGGDRLGHGLAGAAGQEKARLRLVESGADPTEIDLRKALPRLLRGHLRDLQPGIFQERERLADVGVVLAGHPEHAGAAIEALAPAALGLLPHSERAGRPVDVDPVGAVDTADDPRLAPGAGAGIARSPGVEQGDARAAAEELEGGPAAEGAGADDGHVRWFHAATPWVESTPCRPRTGS